MPVVGKLTGQIAQKSLAALWGELRDPVILTAGSWGPGVVLLETILHSQVEDIGSSHCGHFGHARVDEEECNHHNDVTPEQTGSATISEGGRDSATACISMAKMHIVDVDIGERNLRQDKLLIE